MALIALPLAGCKRAPAPAPEAAEAAAPTSTSWVQSVHKLDGAPARVLGTRFSPDGASLLVLERRPPKDEGGGEPSVYAISRRPIAGGGAVDLLASTMEVINFEPLGSGVVAMMYPQVPPRRADGPFEDSSEHLDRIYASRDKRAVYRIDNGGPPVRVSPEGRRCSTLVGAADGQRVAFSIEPEKHRYEDPYDTGVETHVLGANPGDDVTLSIKGPVCALSPDGARAIVRPPLDPPKGKEPLRFEALMKRPRPRDVAAQLVVVSVKDQATSKLPASLQIDGAAIATADLRVSFQGDGLLFATDRGEIYRSALDGSSAARLAGPLPEAADAGAPTDAGPIADADAGAKPPRTMRILGPKGTLLTLSDEAGAVTLASPAKVGDEPIAKLEGPLAAIGDFMLDADEKRVALTVLSDTSRDGSFNAARDDAELFITEAAPGSLSFGRAPAAPLADEIRPRILAAVGVPASAVTLATEEGWAVATVELPWIDGEDAKALLARTFVAARALAGAVPRLDVALRVRVGKINFTVRRFRSDYGQPYLELTDRLLTFRDRDALPLVLRNPVKTSLYASSNQTLTGELENTGAEPTAPIEVFARMGSGYGSSRTYREFAKKIGTLAPGKRAKFNLVLTDPEYRGSAHARFRVEGKELAVFNQYSDDHSLHWLEAVLSVRAAHGAWSEHATRGHDYRETMGPALVHLTSEQAALPAGDREKLFQAIIKVVYEHHRRFHGDEALSTSFLAPGGGGWLVETGKKTQRFEDKSP